MKGGKKTETKYKNIPPSAEQSFVCVSVVSWLSSTEALEPHQTLEPSKKTHSTAGRGLPSRHPSTKTLAVFTRAVRILAPVVLKQPTIAERFLQRSNGEFAATKKNPITKTHSHTQKHVTYFLKTYSYSRIRRVSLDAN